MADDQSPQGQFQQPPPQGQYPPPGRYQPPGQYPQGPRRPEKQDEKPGEKEQEKKQEKGRGMDEKYHRNPLGFVTFALTIIALGVVLLLQNSDVISSDRHGWAIFAWAAGGLVLLEALLRFVMPRFRRPLLGSFIWGAILVGVGFGLWYDRWELIGPIVIIAVGVGILAGRLIARR